MLEIAIAGVVKRAHRIPSQFVEKFQMLATHKHPHTPRCNCCCCCVSNARFTYSFSLIASNPFRLCLIFSVRNSSSSLRGAAPLLLLRLQLRFLYFSATLSTALYMRWHASSSSTFPSSSIVLFFRSTPFWFVFSLSLAPAHIRTTHPRTGFSSHFSDCQILYPILTAINDKRYDAAIKPSRLHITVAIKTMILSTTSIFIVVIVIVRVWFLYSSVVAGRFSSIPLLRCYCCTEKERALQVSVCVYVHDTQRHKRWVRSTCSRGWISTQWLCICTVYSVHTFICSIVHTLARLHGFSLFISTQHLVHINTGIRHTSWVQFYVFYEFFSLRKYAPILTFAELIKRYGGNRLSG